MQKVISFFIQKHHNDVAEFWFIKNHSTFCWKFHSYCLLLLPVVLFRNKVSWFHSQILRALLIEIYYTRQDNALCAALTRFIIWKMAKKLNRFWHRHPHPVFLVGRDGEKMWWRQTFSIWKLKGKNTVIFTLRFSQQEISLMKWLLSVLNLIVILKFQAKLLFFGLVFHCRL